MRLFHAGLDAHALGDMTMPAVGPGDLLVLSIGPGRLASVETFGRIAKSAGADLLIFTAQPTLLPDDLADHAVVIAAQTMASDGGSDAVLPMGSTYEIALFVLVDLITNRVRAGRSESPDEMRARHTNLE
jgi:6-phospho-3-hexuloisomerase